MKASCTLLFAIGLATSAAWAQTEAWPTDPSSGPGSDSEMQDRSESLQDQDATSSGDDSTGASASGAAQAGSEGQLVDKEITASKPRGEFLPLTKAKTENGITYMCGGIGETEDNYMRQTAARDYDLMLTFAARSGHYVADVNVAINDAQGNQVLKTTCDGPIMLVNLPKSGTYRIQADASGHTLNKTVRVNTSRHAKTVFAWPRGAVPVERAAEFRGGEPGETSAGGSEAETSAGEDTRSENAERY